MESIIYHIPALLPECLEALDLHPGGTYIDVTLGGGGHTRAILERLGPQGHLYSMDQDSEAIARAPRGDGRFTAVHGNFRWVGNYMRLLGVERVDGLLGDLGVSFHHFDDPGRGFSFRWEGPLDMRMNPRAPRSAATLLQELDEQELANIFKLQGELRQGRQLAADIVRARATAPVDTVQALLGATRRHIDPRHEKKELAQLFQALRIEVNDELGALKDLLRQTVRLIKPGGRLAIITYHSLEDRLVKNFMRTGRFDGQVITDLMGRSDAPFKPLGSKAITPSDDEVAANPRSRSARLRVAVRV